MSKSEYRLAGIDHVQLAGPVGSEARAREFFQEVLGMREIAKPELLRARGGAWFQCGAQQLHVGIEKDFVPARKAHLAIAVINLNSLRSRLIQHGIKIVEHDALDNVDRLYVDDPFGNRLEFLESK